MEISSAVLKDETGKFIEYHDKAIPIDIEVWTTKEDKLNDVRNKDRIIYSNTFIMKDWNVGNPYVPFEDEDKKIRIPYSEIKITSNDEALGFVYATVHLPGGRTIKNEAGTGILPVNLRAFPGGWTCPQNN